MIAVDASALVAIAFGEAEAEAFLTVLADRRGLVSPVNAWEARVVIASRTGRDELPEILESLDLQIVTLSPDDADAAFHAFWRFGKGRRGLNLGDCFAYALARNRDLPLLYKGQDFARTDVRSAL